MTNTEGGTDDEEFRVAAIKDRVDTTMQVWMGLTMGCAKCHSHKFDPITHEDYYRFYAIFNQTADQDQPSEAPVIPAPTSRFWTHPKIDEEIAPLRKILETPRPRSRPRRRSGNRAWLSRAPPARTAQGDPGDSRHTGRQANQAQAEAGEALSLDRTGAEAVRDKIAALEKSKPAIPNVPVMVELAPDRHRVTHILRKGNFLDPGDVVGPGVPQSLPSLARGSTQEPARAGAVAGRSSKPPDGPGGRQSLLGPDLRCRSGRDRGRLRHSGRASQPSGAARLAGGPVPRVGLEYQVAVAADRHLGDLSSVVEGPARAIGERPAKPSAGACASGPPRGRDGARPGPGLERALEPEGRRAERLPAPAGGPVASGLQRRAHLVDEPGRRPLPPRSLHVLAADGSVSLDGRVRRPQPRDLRDPPGADQYAAPVARDLE